MYEADDITENTEEIILVRQQDAVAAAEFALRMESLDHKRTLGVTLPREAKTLADSERDTAINLKKAEAEIPRSLELNKLALEALNTAHQRAKQNLAELEADRAQFEFKAAADGIFYHGAIENGRWTTGDAVKSLVPHGRPPAHTAFATFVPGAAKLSLVAFLDEATARALKPELAGTATLTGREEVEIPVKSAQNRHRAQHRRHLPRGLLAPPGRRNPSAVTGATAQIRLISYQQARRHRHPHQGARLRNHRLDRGSETRRRQNRAPPGQARPRFQG